MAIDIASSRAAQARDFDGLYKALLETHPDEALRLLCGARLDSTAVILDGPTELPRQRSRQRDKVFLVRNGGGVPTDIYHVEVQVERTKDFQERMVHYWAGLALKYSRTEHRIHQVVVWPVGGGYPGLFSRDQARLEYLSVNVPDDLDPDLLLASPLAPLALWSKKPPPDVVERVADRIAATVKPQEKLVLTELGLLVESPVANQLMMALERKGMNDVIAQSKTGREIARGSLEKGMRVALRARFGDLADLDDLARYLADRDFEGNLARVVSGATLAELRS